MTNTIRPGADDPYRDLPYLLKPSPVNGEKAAVDQPANTTGRKRARNPVPPVPPAPPAAGFNPYFDLPPDVDAASPPGGSSR